MNYQRVPPTGQGISIALMSWVFTRLGGAVLCACIHIRASLTLPGTSPGNAGEQPPGELVSVQN
jgi:hypothetical protein